MINLDGGAAISRLVGIIARIPVTAVNIKGRAASIVGTAASSKGTDTVAPNNLIGAVAPINLVRAVAQMRVLTAARSRKTKALARRVDSTSRMKGLVYTRGPSCRRGLRHSNGS